MLTVQWFDKGEDKTYFLGSNDDIPCQSVFEELCPVLRQGPNRAWVITNEDEVLRHIKTFK